MLSGDDETAPRMHIPSLWSLSQVTSEKMIRKQLTEQTGEDMAPRKAFIRDQVRCGLSESGTCKTSDACMLQTLKGSLCWITSIVWVLTTRARVTLWFKCSMLPSAL